MLLAPATCTIPTIHTIPSAGSESSAVSSYRQSNYSTPKLCQDEADKENGESFTRKYEIEINSISEKSFQNTLRSHLPSRPRRLLSEITGREGISDNHLVNFITEGLSKTSKISNSKMNSLLSQPDQTNLLTYRNTFQKSQNNGELVPENMIRKDNLNTIDIKCLNTFSHMKMDQTSTNLAKSLIILLADIEIDK